MLPLEQLLVPSRELVGEVSAEIESPTVAAPVTYGCSPCHLRLQPISPTVAGERRDQMRLAAGRPCLAAGKTYPYPTLTLPLPLPLTLPLTLTLTLTLTSLQWGVRRPYVIYLLSDLLIICQRHRFQSGSAFKVSRKS